MSKVTGSAVRGRGRAKRKVGFGGVLKPTDWAGFKRDLKKLVKRYKKKGLKVVFG